jgi:hypothetical protein
MFRLRLKSLATVKIQTPLRNDLVLRPHLPAEKVSPFESYLRYHVTRTASRRRSGHGALIERGPGPLGEGEGIRTAFPQVAFSSPGLPIHFKTVQTPYIHCVTAL